MVRVTASDPAPYVSVFVLNYNGLEVLPACLEALRHTDYPRGPLAGGCA